MNRNEDIAELKDFIEVQFLKIFDCLEILVHEHDVQIDEDLPIFDNVSLMQITGRSEETLKKDRILNKLHTYDKGKRGVKNRYTAKEIRRYMHEELGYISRITDKELIKYANKKHILDT